MPGPNDGPDFAGLTITDFIASLGKGVGQAIEYALHAAEIARLKAQGSSGIVQPNTPIVVKPKVPAKRGLVLPLTRAQRLQRMRYIAQLTPIGTLDDYIRDENIGHDTMCPDIFYLLKDHNGGKDPTAPDPADRWTRPGTTFINRTCDCIGGMCWCGGWDRYQPIRFAHIYGGWINTDSMCMECDRVEKGASPEIAACFRRKKYPEAGDYVVCRSGTPGHKVGHIGGILEAPLGLDLSLRDSWRQIKVVDVASRTPKKANAQTTAIGWYGTNAYFVEPVMAAA